MTYLLDTDHITVLQRETGREYATLQARLAQHPPTALTFPIISLHEQVVRQFQAGQTSDDMDYVEWASLVQMTANLQQRLRLLTGAASG